MKTRREIPKFCQQYIKIFLCLVFPLLLVCSNQIDGQTTPWQQIPDMSKPKAGLSASAVDGMIYAIGGGNGAGLCYDDVEMYVPEFGVWMTKAPMPTARWMHASAVVDGKIYAMGGGWPGSVLNVLEVYDPSMDSWEVMTPMPTPRAFLGAAVVDGIIYAIGGGPNLEEHYAVVEAYDPMTNMWSTKAPMEFARGGLGICVFDNKIYAIGGGDVDARRVVERYDPKTDSWERMDDLPSDRFAAFACDVQGCSSGETIYLFGGTTAPAEPAGAMVNGYLPELDTWNENQLMPYNNMWMGGTILDGKIYILGGESECKIIEPHADIYSSVYTFDCDALTKSEELSTVNDSYLRVWPNPLRDDLNISFNLEENGYVNLAMINSCGELVATLLDGTHMAGDQINYSDVMDLPGGLYYVRLQHPAGIQVSKIIVEKNL